MKMLLASLVLLVGVNAHAYYEQFSCNSTTDGREGLSFTLAALDKSTNVVNEGVPVPYRLIVKDLGKVVLDVKVKASSEDVYFQFTHRSRKFGNITGYIYLDELDQTGLTINGTSFDFDCNSEVFQ